MLQVVIAMKTQLAFNHSNHCLVKVLITIDK